MNITTTNSFQRLLGFLTLFLGALALVLTVIALRTDPDILDLLEKDLVEGVAGLLYQAAGMLVLEQSLSFTSSPFLAWARLSALAFAAMATVTIIHGISASVRRWTSLRWMGWMSRLRPSRAHVAVLGLDPMSLRLIRDIRNGRAGRRRVVAVEAGKTDSGGIREATLLGALVLPGEARDPRTRKQLRLDLAREIFVTAPDDALAIDITGDLLRVAGRSGKNTRQCYVHVGDPSYADLFRENPLFQSPDDTIQFHTFNDRELAARQLFLDEHIGLATAHAPDESEIAHYVLVGFGATGQTIATQAARLAHFAGLDRLRMTIVDDFCGSGSEAVPAASARRTFMARYPAFAPESLDLLAHAHLTDPGKDKWSYRGPTGDYRPPSSSARCEPPAIEYVVNAEFLDIPPDDPDLTDQLCARFNTKGDRKVCPVIITCFEDEGRNFRTALRLKELLTVRLKEEAQKGDSFPPIPIFAFLPREEGLAELIRSLEPNAKNSEYRNENKPVVSVHPAGMHSEAVSYRHIVQPVLRNLARSIARHYEETYCNGEIPDDFWEKLSPSFKKSNEDAAAHAVVKLRMVGSVYPLYGASAPGSRSAKSTPLTLPESIRPAPVSPSILGRVEHNRYVAERLLSEWHYKPYPEGYDALPEAQKQQIRAEMKACKRRASLCPFEDLPKEDIPKDNEQVLALNNALGKVGIEVPKLDEWVRSHSGEDTETQMDSTLNSTDI